MIDLEAEVEQLRQCYDELLKNKRKDEQRKFDCKASKRQIHLYEQGKKKLLVLRSKERDEAESRDDREWDCSDPSPIPICDRLYKQGMAKVMAEKQIERKKIEEEKKRQLLISGKGRNPSSIAICDRLYEQGMSKKK